ncbi:DUF551 domain-containing protein [Escherichia coli]
MTTITKERIELFIKNPLENGLTRGEQMELARIALASLEAEPVAKIIAHYPLGVDVGKQKFVQAIRELPDFGGYLFAAPPAPIVPEEMYWQDAPVEGSSKAAAYATGWNDCREAMLQSGNFRENKDSSTNNFRKIPEASTSSPVTPDGWISCSDRMPEMGERQYYVLAADFKNNYPPSIPNTQVGVYGDWFNDGNPTWDDGDGEDLHLKEVTHWMPLPEPPKEVRQ